ncbi:TolC family protein [Falsiroseomonas sp. CW058]|uniref:TolC family protein n=1 Tax=Falsiroseomonas sp. CW058 TaxID=3388664 RepID=UPI003D314AE4
MQAATITPALAQDGAPARRRAAALPQAGAEALRPGAALNALLEAAQSRSPTIRAAELRIAAAQGELRQAGVYPNPELSVDAENIGGSGPYRGTRSLETTVGVAQLLEVNGARTARIGSAQAGLEVARRELEVARLELKRDITIGYAAFVTATRNAEVERERLRLAGEVVRATQARMTAGRDPLVELRRAEVAQASARIAIERAEREIDSARRALATLLGVPTIDVAADNAWFETIGPAPGAIAPPAAGSSPDLARQQAEVARVRAALSAERANALPNPTLRAGVRQFQDSRDTAAVVGLSLPIPVFDRNRGAIERAGSDLARAEAEAQQAALALTASLTDAVRRLDLAWREVESTRRVVLPAAREAQALAREGYAAGRFSLLEALDAQRTFTEARLQLNAALNDVHARRAEVERLAGRLPPRDQRQGDPR